MHKKSAPPHKKERPSAQKERPSAQKASRALRQTALTARKKEELSDVKFYIVIFLLFL